MIHFIFLLGFAFFVAAAFAVFSEGDMKDRLWYGLKVFLQFVGISLIVAWIFYFLPY
jgi:hypothetical protein